MKALKISLLVTMMFLALAPQGFSYVPESNEKPVNVVVDFYPNYAGHLLGVAEIGYQSNYADIYQDLKDFIYLYQKNTEMAKENAVSECKRLFQTRWGVRLTRAHTVIHEIRMHYL